MGEWFKPAVLKTVEVKASGGSNPSLRKALGKIAPSLLERYFFICALHRPAAGGEGCASRSAQIPERGILVRGMCAA